MRIALLADVHGNKHALDAVLRDIEETRPDTIWFLGDAVGYGPEPLYCYEKLREVSEVFIRGNHDTALFDPDVMEDLNSKAKIALKWTQNLLDQKIIDDMRKIPAFKKIEEQDMFLCHASPSEMDRWRYIFTPENAQKAFDAAKERLIITGHSHLPGAFIQKKRFITRQGLSEGSIKIDTRSRFILNPGSVGQPRDGDPRASYGILDTKTMKFTVHRVEYDIKATASAIADLGLPQFLAERLFLGL